MKYKIQSKKINADNVDVFYWVTWKKNMHKPFVFLHPGSSLNHSSLLKVEELLNKNDYPTVIFDPRGFGYSKTYPDTSLFTLEKYSSDIEAIIKKENFEKPIFLAHSFGFMPVVDYVSRTDNASGIIGVCGSSSFQESAPSKIAFHMFDKVGRYWIFLAMGLRRLFTRSTNTYRNFSELFGKKEYDIVKVFSNAPYEDARLDIVTGKSLVNWNIRRQLQFIDSPILLIYAKNDMMVLPSSGSVIKQLVRGPCDMKILEGTHSLPMTRPYALMRAIGGYLGNIR